MAAADGRESARLSDALFEEPDRFDFFQAVRLLERLTHAQAGGDPRRMRQPVGQDRAPDQEIVRFRAAPSLSFPGSAIQQIRQPSSSNGQPARGRPQEMLVNFMGLTGPLGVLPQHYTRLLVQRAREKDHALRDFLDLFNHRLISLFYRAWQKYRLPFLYERDRLDGQRHEDDWCLQALYALVGLGTGNQRGRQDVNDEAFLYYAGHFAHSHRSAGALEYLLSDYFEIPVEVLELQGQWLSLETEDCTRLPSAEEPQGAFAQLGVNGVVGDRVWDVQSKFRLRVGPLSYDQFRRCMPSGDTLRALCQMTRSFVGPELDFDVQAILLAGEVPWLQLHGDGLHGPCLGWNTWLRSTRFAKDADDAVFSCDAADAVFAAEEGLRQ